MVHASRSWALAGRHTHNTASALLSRCWPP